MCTIPLKLAALNLFDVEYECNTLVHILYDNNFIFFYAKVSLCFSFILYFGNIESCIITVVFNYAHLSDIVVKIITTYLNPVNDTKLVFYCIVL